MNKSQSSAWLFSRGLPAAVVVFSVGSMGMSLSSDPFMPVDEVVAADDCSFCFTEGEFTACHTKTGGCASNEVCSGTGGRLPNGMPWAEARCVPRPTEHMPVVGG